MKKKILFITGSRSEYYIQKPIINELKKSKFLKPLLIVTGSHLSKKFGNTHKDILKDNFKISAKINNLYVSDKFSSRLESMSLLLTQLTKYVKKIRPDCLIAPYDREESIAMAIVGSYMNIPVAHLGAGDKTRYNIDGVIRHSVTKLSSIHFCSTKKNYDRVIKLGEEKWRVFNVGHTAADRYKNFKKKTKAELLSLLNMDVDVKEPLILFIQHPVSNWLHHSKKNIKTSLNALDKINLPTIMIRSNSDPGTITFKNEIKNFKFSNKKTKYFENVEENLFLNIVNHASVLLGNSSMGVLESPLINLPVVNVGLRQKDRQNAGNIIFVKHNEKKIISALNKCIYDKIFLKKIRNNKNLYKNIGASKRIVNILSKILLKKNILNKKITY